jgi:hypothetical protein
VGFARPALTWARGEFEKFSSLSRLYYAHISKLKELSRRTTFIRVTQQINEVFGSKDESKNPVFAAIPDPSAPKSTDATEEESLAKKPRIET